VAVRFNAAGRPGAAGTIGKTGAAGSPGAPGPTASAYAQSQNGFVFVDSATDTTAVQLTANGEAILSVPFAAALHVSGVVRLRNNTGNGNTDQSGCRPQSRRRAGVSPMSGPRCLG
jgi:hypothetical protein